MPKLPDICRMFLGLVLAFGFVGCTTSSSSMKPKFHSYTLNFTTQVDAELQTKVETIDTALRAKHEMKPEQTMVGVLDLQTLRLAMLRPDRMEYAASVPKIGILLAYFQLHPEAATNLSRTTRHELGLMAKASSNEMAAKYSLQMGLKQIQQVLNDYGLYNTNHGGGIWVGKHYSKEGERIPDPVGNVSHGATVRQLLRYFLWLEQGKLVSPEASRVMREIFESPEIPHDQIKFVKGLAGREVKIIRKWGSWQTWLHDSAVVTGAGRHYILVGLTNHPQGDAYLEELARAVDDWMVDAK
jgi:beta-lactamase class A